jgi:DNA-binding response OmpR family regulator
MANKILVVDDDPNIRELVVRVKALLKRYQIVA